MSHRLRFFVVASLVAAYPVLAQNSPAGGKWTYRVEQDKMTDGYWSVFTLRAEQKIGDGLLSGVPEFTITCGKGWRDSQLNVPVVIASDWVEVRAEGKTHQREWGIGEDRRTFFVDGHDWLDMKRVPATKEILRSADIRIKFEAYPGHYFVIQFSPGGIDRAMLNKACGAKFVNEK